MSRFGFKPLYQRIVGLGIVLACVPPLFNLPNVLVVLGGLCIVGGVVGGTVALVRESR